MRQIVLSYRRSQPLLCAAGHWLFLMNFDFYISRVQIYVESVGAFGTGQYRNFDFEKFERLNKNTKAVIINAPNPQGSFIHSIRSKDMLDNGKNRNSVMLSTLYQMNHTGLVYDTEAPSSSQLLRQHLCCYSYKFLLKRERDCYVGPNRSGWGRCLCRSLRAGRALGLVPESFSASHSKVLGRTADISIYKRNRISFAAALSVCNRMRFPTEPSIFVNSGTGCRGILREQRNMSFCSSPAMVLDVLICRISYCVRTDQIEDLCRHSKTC